MRVIKDNPISRLLTEAKSSELIPDADPQPAFLPHGFIRFLENVGLADALEIVHPYPKAINLSSLERAQSKGLKHVQKIKIDYINELISFRASPPHSLGTAMKARAQQLLQTMRGWGKETYGDSGTWLLDPLDVESCMAVGEHLFKQGRTNMWISFAMTGDFSDALSKHKNQRVPILGHERDPFSGRNKPAKNLDELRIYLESAAKFVRRERLEKLTRKLARAEHPELDTLLATEQRQILKSHSRLASKLIDDVYKKKIKWKQLNHMLAALDQPPLDEHDHALIKLFPQDGKLWKNGDLRIESNSLILEFSPEKQFTHRDRANGTKLEHNPKIRIEIKRSPEGKPLIITDDPNNLVYLYPFLNSRDFWQQVDKNIIPLLGKSPYHQIEFMYKLGTSLKEINSDQLEGAMKKGHVDFIVDIISGISEINSAEEDQQYKNGGNSIQLNTISSLLDGINPSDLSGAEIRHPAEQELIENGNFIESIYNLMLKCTPGHHTANTNSSTNSRSEINSIDQEVALGLILTQRIWSHHIVLPPSTTRILEDIVHYGSTNKSASRTLLMIEQQLMIAEIKTFETSAESGSNDWLADIIRAYIHPFFIRN